MDISCHGLARLGSSRKRVRTDRECGLAELDQRNCAEFRAETASGWDRLRRAAVSSAKSRCSTEQEEWLHAPASDRTWRFTQKFAGSGSL